MVEKKNRLNIEWTETAKLQLYEILEYWFQKTQSIAYSEKLSNLVWENTEMISKNPYASIQTDFSDTRKVAMGHFSIFYKIYDTKIIITAFWDNRQDPKKLHIFLKNK